MKFVPKPAFQPLSGERMSARSANTNDGAQVDICDRGFRNTLQDAFFVARVFHPNASDTSSAYRRHEQLKKKYEYGQRIREIEHGVVTPSRPLYNWWYGKESNNILQTPCRYGSTQETKPLFGCYQMA